MYQQPIDTTDFFYALPSFECAADAIDHIRRISVEVLNRYDGTFIISRNVIPTRTNDFVYLECVIVDSDITYAIGPTCSGSLPQVNVTRYDEALRLLSNYLNYAPAIPTMQPELVF